MVSPATSTPLSTAEAGPNPSTHELLKAPSASVMQVLAIARNAMANTKNFGVLLFNGLQDRVQTTPLSPVILKINIICTDVEKIFNIAGSTPWIGFLAGTVQSIAGQVQAVAGIALMVISELSLIFAEISRVDLNLNIKIDPKVVNKWQLLSKLGMELTIHGCLNAIRGTGVALLCSYTFGLGNVILLIPNLSRARNFAPYFEYGTITDQLDFDEDVKDEGIKIENVVDAQAQAQAELKENVAAGNLNAEGAGEKQKMKQRGTEITEVGDAH